jgi:hypothetical protein
MREQEQPAGSERRDEAPPKAPRFRGHELRALGAVAAEHPLAIRQLAAVLDEEAVLADELVLLLRQSLDSERFGPIFTGREVEHRLFLFLLAFLFSAFGEKLFEAGLDGGFFFFFGHRGLPAGLESRELYTNLGTQATPFETF